MMKRLLLIATLTATATLPQGTTNVAVQPDCTMSFSFTATARYPANGYSNTVGCTDWILEYSSTGFSALSLEVDSAPDSSGSPGTWAAFTGKISDGNSSSASSGPGVNPNTATDWGYLRLTGSPAWVSTTLASKTGTGRINGTLRGWKRASSSSSGGGGTPGGSDTQVQFNDAGSFGGNSGFTFNKTTGTVMIGPTVSGIGTTTVATSQTTTDFTVINSSFAPLLVRGNYTSFGSTHQISGINIEVLATPADPSDFLTSYQAGAATSGTSDYTYLIGGVQSAYAQGSGHGVHVVGYLADAEVQSGSAGDVTDFGSYGVVVNSGASVTNAYSFWAHGQFIDGTATNMYGVKIETPQGAGAITNDFAFWASAVGGKATNPYSFWSDESGVFRIKADNTFDSVYQAVPALYNPQFTKYTPGAANYERIEEHWNGNVAEFGTVNGGTGTLRNMRLIGNALLVSSLTTTGSATGKKVVCVDTATGQLYASSASNSCAN